MRGHTLKGQSGRKFKIRFNISIPLLSEYHVPLLLSEVEYLQAEGDKKKRVKKEKKKKRKRVNIIICKQKQIQYLVMTSLPLLSEILIGPTTSTISKYCAFA